MVTCGVLVKFPKGYLMCHPYGREYKYGTYDIPKGCKDEGETEWDCAKRELFEETGISVGNFTMEDLEVVDLGRHPYNNKKDIHLFLLDIHNYILCWQTTERKLGGHLKCTSMVEAPGFEPFPEVDTYLVSNDLLYLFPTLRNVISKLPQVTLQIVEGKQDVFEYLDAEYERICGRKPLDKDTTTGVRNMREILKLLGMGVELEAYRSEIAKFIEKRKVDIKAALTQHSPHSLYYYSSILLVFYAATVKQTKMQEDWPFDKFLLKKVFKDMNISEDAVIL